MRTVKLADCCKFFSGGTPTKGKNDYWNGEIPWFSPKDIKSFELVSSQDRISEIAVRESATRLVKPGTILVVGRSGVLAHTLPIGIVRQPSTFNQDIKAIVPSDDYDPEYVALYLTSRQSFVLKEGVKRGPTVHSLISDFIEELEIPDIPIDHQRQIAARLKAQLAVVETARQAAQAQLREINVALNRAIESQIVDAISSSDETVKLGDVSNITAKLVQPKQDNFANLPHVSAENIESLTGRLLNIRSAKEDGMTSGKYLFDAGDILYSKLRPYLRKVAKPDFDGLCSADMYPIKTDESVLTMDFLKLLLTSNLFTDYANEKSARSRMPKLNREQLFDFEFCLPSLEKQSQCVALIGSFLALSGQASEAAKSILKDINLLPKKILAQAFEV
jgi:type I restriction enzyme S subunit